MFNTADNVIDALEILAEDAAEELSVEEKEAADVMLSKSLNTFGAVNIEYIANGADITVEQAIVALKDVIFQDPEYFEDCEYSIDQGWVILHSLLSGNLKKKLALAELLYQKYPRYLHRTVNVLKKHIPHPLAIEDINIEIGASWIPAIEYSMFLSDILNLRETVNVSYCKEASSYKVEKTEESRRSILNNVTHGVREKYEQHNHTWYKQYYTGLELMEDLLNSKTPKVVDYVTSIVDNKTVSTPVLNSEKTLEAQDKANAMSKLFAEWVKKTPNRRKRFEGYYNDDLLKYTVSHWDGSYLTLSDLNPDIKPHKNQLDGVAQILLSFRNVLIAHSVGAGKTYIIVISAHELKRMGLATNILVVVPNNILQDVANAHRLLYKDDEILVISPKKDFTPKKREATLDKIRDGNQVATYMAESTFNMLCMGKQYWIDKMTDEINDLRTASFNASKTNKPVIDSQIKSLEKKREKFMKEEPADKIRPFNTLGIDCIMIDEAHHYKNIPINTRTENIVGLHSKGSIKCREALEKIHNVKRAVLLTGTPLTNSLTDLFTMQKYLQPNVLKTHKIDTFDAWVNTFGKKMTSLEQGLDTSSGSLREVTRFSSFHNLSELMSMFSQVCNFYYSENPEGLPRYKGAINVVVPQTKIHKLCMKDIAERNERIHNREVSRSEDNRLKLTVHAIMISLDPRLLNPKFKPEPYEKTKIDYCAENIYKLHLEHPDKSQVVFSDIGTPKDSFNVYDCLADALVKLGMKREEIAFIHDAESEKDRERLFAQVNSGEIKVIIGSTQKLGTGVNIQARLIALHHLSIPFKSSDYTQREGRILRKGNSCEEVYIYRYVMESSFDSYMYNLIQNKQIFISSFMSGVLGDRNAPDISEEVLTYGEVKALAIGNPLVKTRVETALALERAKIANRAREKQIQALSEVIQTTPDKVRGLRDLAEICKKDYAHYMANKVSIPNDERTAFGEELIYALEHNTFSPYERLYEKYQGFSVMLPADMNEENMHVIIRSKNGGSYHCKIDSDKSALGCSKTIDYILDHLDDRAERLLLEADSLEKQAESAKEDVAKGNPYTATISRLQSELAHIDAKLEIDVGDKAC